LLAGRIIEGKVNSYWDAISRRRGSPSLVFSAVTVVYGRILPAGILPPKKTASSVITAYTVSEEDKI